LISDEMRNRCGAVPNFLEQERLEEPAQQRVAAQVIPQGRPFFGELLLHAADEDAQGHGGELTVDSG
jgi:hypothetical protein